uniref:Uncharacterized protein n=1 Tax=Romanomermis culicivorax TaxID=13658 RepID=A0A915J2A9_ROMCU
MPQRITLLKKSPKRKDQPKEIEAEQAVQHPQPSPHQLPSRRLEVMELAKPIFLIAQVSVSISPDCQQWVTSTIFPTTTATIPHVIVQPLPTNSMAAELPIETAVVNVTNSRCPLLFVNNTRNSIKLHSNQLLAVAALGKPMQMSSSNRRCGL